jgi:hypothetical protein
VSLPPEPYLYACSDGSRAYLFELQSPGRRLRIEVASYALWHDDPLRGSPGVELGRYLVLDYGDFLDILTLERFSRPALPEATYRTYTFHSPDRWYVFLKDDLYAYWQAQVVNQRGEVLEDLGLVVGTEVSPNLEWVFENRYLGTSDHPDNGPWVQRLRGGTPVHLVGCQSATPWAGAFWDFDGNHLLLVSTVMSNDIIVYRCDVRTDEVEVVQDIQIHGSVDRKGLSPDYRRIAFTQLWGSDQSWLHVADIETGEHVLLHEGGHYHGFGWTRDSKYLVVEVDDGSPEGEGPKMLISVPDGKVYPLRGDYPCWPIRPNPAPYTLADVGSQAGAP